MEWNCGTLSRPLCRRNILWNSNLRGAHVTFTILRNSAKVKYYSPHVFCTAQSGHAFHMQAKCQSLNFFPKSLPPPHGDPSSYEVKFVGLQSCVFPILRFTSFLEAFHYDRKTWLLFMKYILFGCGIKYRKTSK